MSYDCPAPSAVTLDSTAFEAVMTEFLLRRAELRAIAPERAAALDAQCEAVPALGILARRPRAGDGVSAFVLRPAAGLDLLAKRVRDELARCRAAAPAGASCPERPS